ncbi:MAG: glycoside hydrolase family 16 protein, partial [Burkholderiales bacterium]
SGLIRRAAERRTLGALELGDTVRLGMTQGGTQALGRVLATLTISPVAGAIDPVELPVLVPATYVQSFSDDFEDENLGRINENAAGGRPGAPAWRSRYRQARQDVINKEKQIYMDPQFSGTAKAALGVQPFSIRDGVLRIRADRADPAKVSPHIWNYRYTSGCISSELTHWQTYGYFEIRARLPRGKGYWPAFWLLPKRDAWPPEIDVLEGSGIRPYGIHHGAIEKPRKASTPGGVWIDQFIDVSDGFHRYAMDWTRENIIFYVDGTKTFEYGPHTIHEDMYMLVNLALGSRDANWIPDPDDTTPFPGLLEVDYVHAYRRKS